MLKQWNKGNTEEGLCMDEHKESQPCKRLSHSIEEILRRPTVQRSWSVIKENSKLQSLTCAGTLCNFFLLKTTTYNSLRSYYRTLTHM